MSHLPLDARAILDYLNELGYRNISAEQLKEFMKDLRKLIKYEERLGINANQPNYFEDLFKRTTASYRAKIGKENEGCDRVVEVRTKREHKQHVLHSSNQITKHQQQSTNSGGGVIAKNVAHTAHTEPSKSNAHEILSREQTWQNINRMPLRERYEIRGQSETVDSATLSTSRRSAVTAKDGGFKANKKAGDGGTKEWRTYTDRNTKGAKPHTATTARNEPRDHLSRDSSRGRTRIKTSSNERVAAVRSPSGGSYATTRSLGVIIPKNCTATRRRRPLSSDPVALYHYYQSEWNYFRQQIPGENTHSELRWLVRTKMMDPN